MIRLLSDRRILFSLVMVLAVRLGYVWFIYNHDVSPVLHRVFDVVAPKDLRTATDPAYRFGYDARKYDSLAGQLAAGKPMHYGRPEDVMVAAPGFPVLLGMLYRIFGRGFGSVLVFYAFLETGTAVVLLTMFRRALPERGPETAGVFLILFAFYLPYITTMLMPLSECLYVFIITLFFLSAHAAREEQSLKMQALAGVLAGLAVLTRPVFILFPLFMIAADTIRRVHRRRLPQLIPGYAVMGLVAGLMILPWTIRNAYRYGRFIPVSTSGTAARTSAEKEGSRQLAAAGSGEDADDSQIGSAAAVYFKKITRLWFNLGFPRKASPGSVATGIVHSLLLIGSVLALVRIAPLRYHFYLPVLYFMYTTGLHVIFFSTKIRYIMPAMPVFVMLSAILLTGCRSGRTVIMGKECN